MQRLAIVGLYFLFVACRDVADKHIPPPDLSGSVRLGKTNYFIKLPEDIEMAEARGVEGQLGYSFHTKTDDYTSLGFISIELGHPITSMFERSSPVRKTDFVYARFIDDDARWVIEDRGSYLDATIHVGKIWANISTRKRQYIDRMIAVFATLVRVGK